MISLMLIENNILYNIGFIILLMLFIFLQDILLNVILLSINVVLCGENNMDFFVLIENNILFLSNIGLIISHSHALQLISHPSWCSNTAYQCFCNFVSLENNMSN